MSQSLSQSILFGSLAVIASLSFLGGVRLFSQPTSFHANPFVAVGVTSMFDDSAKPIAVVNVTFARRSDGSTYIERSEPNKTSQITIVDTLHRRVILAEPVTGSKSTFTHTVDQFNNYMTDTLPNSHCPAAIGYAVGSRFGHTLHHVTERLDFKGSGTALKERWLLPEFQCFAVTISETFKLSAQASTARETYETKSFQGGDPPDSMFTLPDRLIERSPIDVDVLYKEVRGTPYWGSDMATALERKYISHGDRR